MSLRRGILFVSFLLLPAAWIAGQDALFRVDVKLVRLIATVKSNTGELIGNLSKEDFDLTDSGVKQEIAVFQRSTTHPISVALLVDTSSSAAIKLDEANRSVLRFLEALLRDGKPEDAVTLYSFNDDVTLECSFTRRVGRIEQELKTLKPQAGTSFYDAVFFSSHAVGRREGRRVIVAVTDGADTTSAKNFQDALESVHQADAVMYGIMLIPVANDPGRHIAGENALIALAAGTGGRVFAASLGEMLDSAFDDILRDLRTQYLIGYYPKNLPYSTERFRRVELHVNRPDLRVITRSGYYVEDRDPPPQPPNLSGPAHRPRHQE